MYNIYAIVILILFDIPLFYISSTPISSRCCTKIPEVLTVIQYRCDSQELDETSNVNDGLLSTTTYDWRTARWRHLPGCWVPSAVLLVVVPREGRGTQLVVEEIKAGIAGCKYAAASLVPRQVILATGDAVT